MPCSLIFNKINVDSLEKVKSIYISNDTVQRKIVGWFRDNLGHDIHEIMMFFAKV